MDAKFQQGERVLWIGARGTMSSIVLIDRPRRRGKYGQAIRESMPSLRDDQEWLYDLVDPETQRVALFSATENEIRKLK